MRRAKFKTHPKIAQKVFQKFFLGQSIPGVYDQADQGIYWSYVNNTLDLLLVDDRSFKQPPAQFETNQNAEEEYSLFGLPQHQWLRSQLLSSQRPAFLMCGTQFINGAEAKFIESVEQNKKNFAKLVEDIRQSRRLMVFGSGDLHISEIQFFGSELLGYPMYELTSSSIHSFSPPKIWENKKRIEGTNKFNFMMLQPESKSNTDLKIKLVCLTTEEQPIFSREIVINK